MSWNFAADCYCLDIIIIKSERGYSGDIQSKAPPVPEAKELIQILVICLPLWLISDVLDIDLNVWIECIQYYLFFPLI